MAQGLNTAIPANTTPISSSEIRVNFAALASLNKGPAAPSPVYEGMLWMDDNHATLWVLKQYLSGLWRTLLIYNLSGNVLSITSGIIMAKEDFKNNISASGTKDGVNPTFSVPSGAYMFGTLSVFVNGQQYNPSNIQQNGPVPYETFTIINGDHLPISIDSLTMTYLLA